MRGEEVERRRGSRHVMPDNSRGWIVVERRRFCIEISNRGIDAAISR